MHRSRHFNFVFVVPRHTAMAKTKMRPWSVCVDMFLLWYRSCHCILHTHATLKQRCRVLHVHNACGYRETCSGIAVAQSLSFSLQPHTHKTVYMEKEKHAQIGLSQPPYSHLPPCRWWCTLCAAYVFSPLSYLHSVCWPWQSHLKCCAANKRALWWHANTCQTWRYGRTQITPLQGLCFAYSLTVCFTHLCVIGIPPPSRPPPECTHLYAAQGTCPELRLGFCFDNTCIL